LTLLYNGSLSQDVRRYKARLKTGRSYGASVLPWYVTVSYTSTLEHLLPKTTKRKDMKLIVLSPCNAAEEHLCVHPGYVTKRYSGRGL
jgi:hypothetical protein